MILFVLEAILGFSTALMLFFGSLFAVLGIVEGLVTLVALVAFFVWFYRANKNLRALGATELSFTPGWSVVWWFIPIANIWMPYKATVEIAKASDPSVGSTDRLTRRQMKSPRLILVWWLFSILSLFVFFAIAFASAGLWASLSQDELESTGALVIELGSASVSAVSLWLTIMVVKEITKRQTEKIQSVRTGI
jgi:heme/copper-type cytochrome/quinol oxidase subunit 2